MPSFADLVRLARTKQKFDEEKEFLNGQLLNAVDLLLTHKTAIQAILEDVESEVTAALKQLH